jgi:hypothetical protein
MTERRLFVCVPGFGPPRTEIKWGVLRHNLRVLRNANIWGDIDIVVCSYDPSVTLPKDLEGSVELACIPSGIVAEFIIKYAPPQRVMLYDNVMILLDDVALDETSPEGDWKTILNTMDSHDIHLASPALRSPTMTFWKHMVQDDQKQVRVTNVLECFCYLFKTPACYTRYYALLDMDNKMIWGVDWILSQEGKLTCAVFDNLSMDHLFFSPSKDDATDERYHDAVRYLRARGYDWHQMRARGIGIARLPLSAVL